MHVYKINAAVDVHLGGTRPGRCMSARFNLPVMTSTRSVPGETQIESAATLHLPPESRLATRAGVERQRGSGGRERQRPSAWRAGGWKRVGGKIMDVHEWFDEICEKWGVPKKLEELES
jgi:hypothetical protein